MSEPVTNEAWARETLAEEYDRAGYRDEAAAFRAGRWTCHDHPAIRAMLRFVDLTASRGEGAAVLAEREACAKVADDLWAADRSTKSRIAAAIRARTFKEEGHA